MAEWYKFMVYFCADTMATYICMQGKCKIQCGRVLWHGLNFTFRGEYKNFRCKQVQFDSVEEINGIRLRIIKNFLDGT